MKNPEGSSSWTTASTDLQNWTFLTHKVTHFCCLQKNRTWCAFSLYVHPMARTWLEARAGLKSQGVINKTLVWISRQKFQKIKLNFLTLSEVIFLTCKQLLNKPDFLLNREKPIKIIYSVHSLGLTISSIQSSFLWQQTCCWLLSHSTSNFPLSQQCLQFGNIRLVLLISSDICAFCVINVWLGFTITKSKTGSGRKSP